MILCFIFSQIRCYLETAKSGLDLHIKLFFFVSLPFWMLLVTTITVLIKINRLQNGENVVWWTCLIPSISFSAASCFQLFFVNRLWCYCSIITSLPLICFQFLWCQVLDEKICTEQDGAPSCWDAMYLLLQIWALTMLVMRAVLHLIHDPYY